MIIAIFKILTLLVYAILSTNKLADLLTETVSLVNALCKGRIRSGPLKSGDALRLTALG